MKFVTITYPAAALLSAIFFTIGCKTLTPEEKNSGVYEARAWGRAAVLVLLPDGRSEMFVEEIKKSAGIWSIVDGAIHLTDPLGTGIHRTNKDNSITLIAGFVEEKAVKDIPQITFKKSDLKVLYKTKADRSKITLNSPEAMAAIEADIRRTSEKVTDLSLGGKDIRDVRPLVKLLKKFKQLRLIDASENKISDITDLKELKQLTHLSLAGNQISDLTPVKDLTQLRDLSLGNNQINDVSILKELKQLTHLDLGGNHINDVSALKELKQLTFLSVSYNKCSDLSAFKEFKELKNLKVLGLVANKINDISALKELKQLTYLNLSNNPDLTKTQIEELQKALPNCKIDHNAK